RTAKPAAKLSKVKMNAAAGLTPEKKCLLISTAKAPTTKKSYHSNTVPSEDANTSSLSLFVMATLDGFRVPMSSPLQRIAGARCARLPALMHARSDGPWAGTPLTVCLSCSEHRFGGPSMQY